MDMTLVEHNQHYAPNNIDTAISAALAALNNDGTPLDSESLAGLDQFHIGGIQSTRALAQRAALTAADRVLDVGGGLGGPARVLASEIGCHVTVVDLTEAYCRAGERLTARVKLSDRVRFQQGDALDLPFEDGSFDVVWTQHSTMNIPDKARLYAQIQQVLRPGGRLALYEITAGSGEAIHLPVMWAHSEAMSFLMPSQALRDTVIEAGFRELNWTDMSDWAMAWFGERQRVQQSSGAAPSPLGLHLLVGADLSIMVGNLARNLKEGRIRVVEGIFERI